MRFPHSLLKVLTVLISCAFLLSCGGGGGSSSTPAPAPPPDPGPNTSYQPGVFQPSEEFAAACEAPRSGINPATGRPWPDSQGSVLTENHWLRSWSNETYLWYDEITDRNPADFSDPLAYFDILKTPTLTQSGRPRDRFHFTRDTQEWQQLSQSGLMLGYGMKLVVLRSTPPRQLVVNFVHDDSPAEDISRGTRILEIDGIDVVNSTSQSDLFLIDRALSPQNEGETHSFRFQPPAGIDFELAMAAQEITIQPVPVTTTFNSTMGTVAYLMFTDHIATAEEALVNAFLDLQSLPAGPVNNLILDLRFNGGGLLAVASQLAYMIAGPVRTSGKIFEQQRFNDQHPDINPVTGEQLAPLPFLNQTIGMSYPPGLLLPSLDLDRVFILTGPDTCSASESVINGLRGAGVEVIQVGYTTCGKPYGFYPTDNCGTTYFTIQFRGENDIGFGDYADGFSPQNMPGAGGEAIPGCAVPDNITITAESATNPLTQAALNYINTSTCPAPPLSSALTVQPQSLSDLRDGASALELSLPRPFSTSNRILGLPR